MSVDTNVAPPVLVAYKALVTSAAPADPVRAGTAALRASSRDAKLPDGFGADPARDGEWLASALGDASPWPAIGAMTWSANVPHTALVPPPMRAGINGMRTGVPPIEPGFLMHALPGGGFVIADVAPGCSAERAGMKVGDVVESVGGDAVERPVAQYMRMFRHPPGTKLDVVLVRDGERITRVLELVEGRQKLVEASSPRPGIVRVFLRAVTASEDPERDVGALVRRAVTERLASGKVDGIIVDVRSNPGGNGEGSSRVAAALIDGTPMLSFRTPDGKEQNVPRFGDRIAGLDAPVVVLVDDQSSSAAEMLGVALRENGGAKIVGEPTAGALTQPAFTPLADGFGLMTPGARSIGPKSRAPFDGNRLVPDVRVPNRTVQDLLTGADAQLAAAIGLLTRA
jgi:C-terminal processing protease CtpA/Prc